MGRWHKYYQALTVADFIGNLFGQREFLAEIIKLSPRKLLEIGAGSGSLSIFLSYLGLEVVASDQDGEMAALIRANNQRFGGKLRAILQADSQKLPFAQDEFDLIFHQGVLEHFSDEEIKTLLKEQLRVAERVLFSVPNQNYPRKDLGDERLQNSRAWRKILRDFKIVWQKDYSFKVFPRFYLPRARIQQMILLER